MGVKSFMQLSDRFFQATKTKCEMENHISAPYLRYAFPAHEIKSAELTVCGLGFYELYINGQKITKGLLSPYISIPDHICYYDCYDLTPYLTDGENVIGLMLGNGMQNPIGARVWGFEKGDFVGATKFALSCTLISSDGTETSFDGSVFKTHPSPIVFDDLRAGEWYDARLEITDWCSADYDDEGWTTVIPAPTPMGEMRICDIDPILPQKELNPLTVKRGKISIYPNECDFYSEIPFTDEERNTTGWIYDFGENAAGLCRLKVKNTKPGQRIIMQFGEILGDNPTGEPYKTVRNENSGLDLRGIHFLPHRYNNRDVYVCRGDEEEIWMPQFTYHGFRYCFVSGITDEQATPELLTYVVMNTNLKQRATFRCSDDMANKLWDATLVADLANFYHFPTDCPHREKNGWTGDIAVSAEQMIMTFSAERNFKEWMHNVRKSVNDEGAIPGIVPSVNWWYDAGPAWDSAMVYVPYYVWLYRGDTEILKDNADVIYGYLKFLDRKRNERGLLDIGLGDWVQAARASVDNPTAPRIFTSTIIAMDLCEKSGVIFDTLGMRTEKEYAKKLYDELYQSSRKYMLNLNTMTAVYRCQAAQAMAIYYNLFTPAEKQTAIKVLVDIINENNGFIDCGILGLRVIFHVLSSFGYTDLAYKMITRDEFPSYGYWIKHGATALWELFSPISCGQSSCNHHFMGDIISWFMKNLVGINFNPFGDNAAEVRFEPKFIDALDNAEGSLATPHGTVTVKWYREGTAINYEIEIPDGITADLVLEKGWQTEDGFTAIPVKKSTNVKIIPAYEPNKLKRFDN